VVFTPGAPIEQEPGEEARARLAAAQTRIDTLLRRVDALEASLAGAHRNLERAEQRHRSGEQEAGLRTEISRLEGALAEARAEVRKAEEATRGNVSPGKRPIEME
jgi:multidrug resistance efflux pump